MTQQRTLYLASSSPRRQEILSALDLEFSIKSIDVDETRLDGETPEQMVLRLAVAKAMAADVGAADLVLGADTAVLADGEVLGKPRDEDDAVAMLMRLSGRSHQVITGVALRGPGDLQTILCTSEVRFRDIGRDEAFAYWQSGEPSDKAGAYAIQGIGGIFVEGIEGSYSGVVGLPVFETTKMLSVAGIDVLPKQNKNDG